MRIEKRGKNGQFLKGNAINFVHGQAKRINGKVVVSRLYRAWQNMLSRCENPKVKCFKYYGAKGRTVCSSWHKASTFITWAQTHGYRDDLTIDRIDNDGNYEPGNCRWVTFIQNIHNRRPQDTSNRVRNEYGQFQGAV
jgi:hypothetical protein